MDMKELKATLDNTELLEFKLHKICMEHVEGGKDKGAGCGEAVSALISTLAVIAVATGVSEKVVFLGLKLVMDDARKKQEVINAELAAEHAIAKAKSE